MQSVDDAEAKDGVAVSAVDAGAKGTDETAADSETFESAGIETDERAGSEVEYGGVKYLEREVRELQELAVGERVMLVGTLVGIEPGAAQ